MLLASALKTERQKFFLYTLYFENLFQFKGVINAKVHAIRTHGPPEFYQCNFCLKVKSSTLLLATSLVEDENVPCTFPRKILRPKLIWSIIFRSFVAATISAITSCELTESTVENWSRHTGSSLEKCDFHRQGSILLQYEAL